MLGQVLALAYIGGARAEEPTPTEAPQRPTEPSSATDEELLEQALNDENVIVVWGSRPERVYDRDTPLRLTGAELRRRGISNVAEALDLLPEVYVRAAGRGGRQIDVRGARKGSVKILLDGISIGDPYYGNIDLSAIPITDIEQIRVSASPASPIDGPGGPGGVIEIFTSDAVGPGMVRARMIGSSLPSGEASATARASLTPNLAARISASATLGDQDYELLEGGEYIALSEDREQSVGAVRIEYRDDDRRFAARAAAGVPRFCLHRAARSRWKHEHPLD